MRRLAILCGMLFLLAGSMPVWADVIQTQPSATDPFEADIIKAEVRDNVLPSRWPSGLTLQSKRD
jgi:hypothetical protein